MSLFIPKKIKVGYQDRDDTYTGKLAYVIYYDANGKLRKEASWKGWRKEELGSDEFDNSPTEGFVLNKKVGGYQYHYDMRQTYTRVYDPRGFEIEISIPNLLHILENTDCIKGKGLMGEFVYAWNGTELVLLSTSSPDYDELCKKTETLIKGDYFKGKELIPGKTYADIEGKMYTYLGKFPKYISSYYVRSSFPYINKDDNVEEYISKGSPVFWFKQLDDKYIINMSSVTRKFYSCVDENVHPEFQTFLSELQCNPEYSPIDFDRYDIECYTFEDFEAYMGSSAYYKEVAYLDASKNVLVATFSKDFVETDKFRQRYNWWSGEEKSEFYHRCGTVKELFDYYRPIKVTTYLKNGNVYRKEFQKNEQ